MCVDVDWYFDFFYVIAAEKQKKIETLRICTPSENKL